MDDLPAICITFDGQEFALRLQNENGDVSFENLTSVTLPAARKEARTKGYEAEGWVNKRGSLTLFSPARADTPTKFGP